MASAPIRQRLIRQTPAPNPPAGVSVMASTLSSGWRHVEGMVVEGCATEPYRHRAADPVVAFHLSGVTRVEWIRDRRYTRFLSEPGALTIIPAGGENSFLSDRWSRWLLLAIDREWLESLADDDWHRENARLEIFETSNNRDAALWTLGQTLAEHIGTPVAGSRPYGEALSTQIAIHLLWNHSSLANRESADDDQLTDVRLRRVVDFIQNSLGSPASLNELADIAGLSSNYFLSAFKKATGRTPHRFLTEKRIERACELLQNPHCSLVDVSLAVGFSSQSHLTTVFRRFMKTTPAAYREEILGLRPDGRRTSQEIARES